MSGVAFLMKHLGVPFIADIAPLIFRYHSSGLYGLCCVVSNLATIAGAVEVSAPRSGRLPPSSPRILPSAVFFLSQRCCCALLGCGRQQSAALTGDEVRRKTHHS